MPSCAAPKDFRPAHMLDQSHNVTDPIESLMLSAIEVQRAYASALLVDRQALEGYQDDNDALMATQTLKAAFRTDVEPILAMARLEIGRRDRSGRRLPGQRLSRQGRGRAAGRFERRRRHRLVVPSRPEHEDVPSRSKSGRAVDGQEPEG